MRPSTRTLGMLLALYCACSGAAGPPSSGTGGSPDARSAGTSTMTGGATGGASAPASSGAAGGGITTMAGGASGNAGTDVPIGTGGSGDPTGTGPGKGLDGGTQVPAAWTCAAGEYVDNRCDCGCGVADPACNGNGCTTPLCATSTCNTCHDKVGSVVPCPGDSAGDSGVSSVVDAPAPPYAWQCSAASFHDDACDCGCGALDPTCQGNGCASPLCMAPACTVCHDKMGILSKCPLLKMDAATPRPDARTVPSDWTCLTTQYQDNVCDCGCGVPDPACQAAGCTSPGCAAEACLRCHDSRGLIGICAATSDAGPPDGSPPSGWICSVNASRDLVCDCGCGAEDPACQGAGCTSPLCGAPACAICHDKVGNLVPCPSAIDAAPKDTGIDSADTQVPDACVAESDEALCASRSFVCGKLDGALDKCGQYRIVSSCGVCASSLTCGSRGRCCDPAAESEAAFCTRMGANCGMVMGEDACLPAFRTVNSCGTCSGAKSVCFNNVCGECIPGAYSCADPANPKLCSESRTLVATQPCNMATHQCSTVTGCVPRTCFLTDCSYRGFTYSCSTSSSNSATHYEYDALGNLVSWKTTYSFGVICQGTWTTSKGTCSDDTGASCTF